ncbi:MAG: hypothetical protein HXX08_20265 [Chloroflexi bacterium]|uniref:Uncharacterized protein n=1 Tax=Candidatus Chlorohelix allophototropha TaxID=3003348 RepID=A0A8T7M842_9CHLR|nr:hypothetical protein [Chloroflexota bacterium]WJW68133.1 hypothetical protein OZ401_003736 [Chloroflexota bacterium L227-S17]
MSKVIAKPEKAVISSNKIRLWLASSWRDEMSLWRKALSSPALYLLVLVSVGVFVLSWQPGWNYNLDQNSHFRLDEPFVSKFNGREPTTPTPNVPNSRWTRGESYLNFMGVGKHEYGLRLKLQPGGNPNPNLDLYVYANETLIGYYKIDSGKVDYDFVIPASAITGIYGDLRLTLKTTPFYPPDDPRELGLVFWGAEITAMGTSFTLPPVTQLLYLLATVLFTYLIVTRAGLNGWVGFGTGATVLAVMAYVIATPARPWLTIFSAKLSFAFFLALLALVILDLPMRAVWQYRWERAWVLSFFGLALAIRFGGTLHPHIQMTDMGFHYNHFQMLWDKGLFFQKIQSAEWGGKETYYPTTGYFMMGLFQWLIPDVNLLQKFWMTAFDTSRALLAFYLVKKTVGDGRTAVFAAFFMVTIPVAWISIGFGQVSNMYGEWLMMVALCLVAVKYKQLNRPFYFFILTLTLLASFMQHPGVTILSGAVFLLFALVQWFRERNGAKFLGLAYLLALVLSIAIYHRQTLVEMIPQALDTISSKVSGTATTTKGNLLYVGGSVADPRLGLIRKPVNNFGDWLWGGLSGFWAEGQVYFNLIPLIFALWALWWLWNNGKNGLLPVETEDNIEFQEGRGRLLRVSLSWYAIALLFAILGWITNLYVRYSLFALPVVAVGAGIFSSRLWKRQGWRGKLLVLLIAVFFVITILALWYDRVIFRSTELRD